MFNTIHSDLIRGHIDTIILKALLKGDRYGYDICKEIETLSSGQYQLKQPTLYSCLKRLENQGFITSYWGEKTNGGRRKYYTLTEIGKNLFVKNQTEWEFSRTIIDQLISDRKFNLDALPPLSDKSANTTDKDEPKEIQTDTTQENHNSKPDNILVDLNTSNITQPSASAVINNQNAIHTEALITLDSTIKRDDLNIASISRNPPTEPIVNKNSYFDTLSISAFTKPERTKQKDIDDKFARLNSELFSQELNELERMEAQISQKQLENGYRPSENNIANFYDPFSTPISQVADLFTRPSEFEDYSRPAELSFNNSSSQVMALPEAHPHQLKAIPMPPPPNTTPNSMPFNATPTTSGYTAPQTTPYTRPSVTNLQTMRNQSFTFQGEIEREYKSVLNRLFRKPEQENDNVTQSPAETIIAEESSTKDKSEFENEKQEPDFVIVDEHKKTFDFDESTKKTTDEDKENIFFNINGEFEQGERRTNETYKVKLHNKSVNKEYSYQFYIFSNKMRLACFSILSALMIVELLLMIGIFHLAGLDNTSKSGLYFLCFLLPVALIAISCTAYKINPQKKQRAQFNFGNNLLFYGILFIMTVMIILLINLIANMTIFNYKEYLINIIVPSVLAFNFIIHTTIYYLFYKSKKFSV